MAELYFQPFKGNNFDIKTSQLCVSFIGNIELLNKHLFCSFFYKKSLRPYLVCLFTHLIQLNLKVPAGFRKLAQFNIMPFNYQQYFFMASKE